MKKSNSLMRTAACGLFFGAVLLISPLYSSETDFKAGKWTELCPGMEMTTVNRSGENPIAAFVIKIDVHQENLRFFSTPPCENYQANQNETIRQTAVDFLTENHLTAAINANFYSPFNETTQRTPGESNLHGAAVSQGTAVSPPEEKFPVFTATADNKIEIKVMKEGDSFEGIETAVAGNQIILQDGQIVETGNNDAHPRTAVGISPDKRYVYFLVIDGRQKNYSVGATYQETAEILQLFDAADGLNLDGGGSTTMVTAVPQSEANSSGEYRVINNPVGQSNQPGTLRYNGNHLGVGIK